MAKDNGRPPVFSKPKDLADAISKYFKSPPLKTIRTKDGDLVEVPILTITGLCLIYTNMLDGRH